MLQLKEFFINIVAWIVYFWQRYKIFASIQRQTLYYIILGIVILIAAISTVVIILSIKRKKQKEQLEYAAASDTDKQAIITEGEPIKKQPESEEKKEVFSVQEEKEEEIEEPTPVEEVPEQIEAGTEELLEAEEEKVEPAKMPEKMIKKSIEDERASETKDIIKNKFVHRMKSDLETEFINIARRYFPEKVNFKEKMPMDEDDISRCNNILEKLDPLSKDRSFKFSKEYFQCKSIFYFSTGQDDLFEQNIRKEIELYPDDETLLLQLSAYYFNKNDLDQAEQYTQKAKDINPSNFDAYFLLGEIYFEKNDFHNSLEMFKNVLLLDPRNSTAYAYKGYMLAQKGYVSDGEKCLRKAIDLSHKNHFPYYFLGNIYKNLRIYDKAINNYEKAEQLNCPFLESRENYAFCLLKMKKHEDVINLLAPLEKRKALSNKEKEFLSKAYENKRDYKNAVELLVQAHEETKNHDDAMDLELKIGHIYFHNLQNYKKAEAYYSLFLEKDKDNYQVNQNVEHINYQKSKIKLHNNVGVIYAQRGDYQQAVKEFEKALEIELDNPEAIYNLDKASKLLSHEASIGYQEKKVV